MQKSKIITSKIIVGNSIDSSARLQQIRLSSYQTANMERAIKEVKYPIMPLLPARNLNKKIQTFENQSVKAQLRSAFKLSKCNCIRQVRGDGNCFFRAIAFLHLTQLKSTKLEGCFCYIDDIDLNWCSKQSIPKMFRQYYNSKFLKQLLKRNWSASYQQYLSKCDGNYKKALTKLLNQNNYLDFIVILYYRSLCYKAFVGQIEEYKAFMRDEETEKKEILNYSCESQGIILDVCSRFFKLQLKVLQIRQNKVCSYILQNPEKKHELSLLYSDKHYDIIDYTAQLEFEESDEIEEKQQDFYSEVSTEKQFGECVECGLKRLVFKDLGICERCFNTSKNNMGSYQQKQRFIEGRCTQCYRLKQVSQGFRICQQCIRYQQEQQARQRQRQKQNRLKIRCQKCGQLIKQAQACLNCEQKRKRKENQMKTGKCLICYNYTYVYVQIGICERCRQYQQLIAHKEAEKYKSQSQPTCQKCGKKYTKGQHHRCINTRETVTCKQCGGYICGSDGSNLCSTCQRKVQKQEKSENQEKKEKLESLGKSEIIVNQLSKNLSKLRMENSPIIENKGNKGIAKLQQNDIQPIVCVKCKKTFKSSNRKEGYLCFSCEQPQHNVHQSKLGKCLRCQHNYPIQQITRNICYDCSKRDAAQFQVSKDRRTINQQYYEKCQDCRQTAEVFASSQSNKKLCLQCKNRYQKNASEQIKPSIRLKVQEIRCSKCGNNFSADHITMVCNESYCKFCCRSKPAMSSCCKCSKIVIDSQMLAYKLKNSQERDKVCRSCQPQIEEKIRSQKEKVRQKQPQGYVLCRSCKNIKVFLSQQRNVCKLCYQKGQL